MNSATIMVIFEKRTGRSARMSRFGLTFGAFAALLLAAAPARAQISFTSAIDLALGNSPRVKMAQADVDKARAALAETHDVYIPTVTASSGAGGYAYGFPLSPPTVFSFASQSLVFSYSQKDYIRSAEDGLRASGLALKDAREQVAQDAIATYFQLDHAQQAARRHGRGGKLRRTPRDHRQNPPRRRRRHPDGVHQGAPHHRPDPPAAAAVTTTPSPPTRSTSAASPGSPASASQPSPAAFPPSLPRPPLGSGELPDTPAVQAAFATAQQKLQQAFGDARYTWRPQISFGAEYARFSTFNNQYVVYYPTVRNLEENAVGFGLQITIPMFDAGHKAKARESMADAIHAQQEAQFARDQELEGRHKLEHSTAELAAREELASLDRDMAQEQLDVILVQLKATPSNSTPVTPKDERTPASRSASASSTCSTPPSSSATPSSACCARPVNSRPGSNPQPPPMARRPPRTTLIPPKCSCSTPHAKSADSAASALILHQLSKPR